MRRALRTAGILAAGTIGCVLVLAGQASADIVDPTSARQPNAAQLEESPPKPIASSGTAPASGTEDSSGAGTAQAADEAAVPGADGQVPAASPVPTLAPQPPRTTPAPEQILTRVPSVPGRASVARAEQVPAPLERVVSSVHRGWHNVGVFLGQAAGACQVGMATGAGGPVFVLAVLSLATALTRQRVLRTRLVADEDAPEFLYAWEVIAPG